MQSKFLLFTLSFIYTFIAQAQHGIITGKITDASNNQVLVGSTITIKNSKAKTLSDVDGVYRIGNLASGQYILEISYVGYASKEISDIAVINNKIVSLNIILEPQSTTIQDVVVTTTSLKKESLNSILITRKNAAVVSDGISADIIR